jgi:DNA mismatch repair protein MutS
MQQYHAAMEWHPNMLILFRVGDFYELYGDHAETAAEALGLVLTTRTDEGQKIPMAGFPHHALEQYLRRLLSAGHRVAICEQAEQPPAEVPAEAIQPSLFDEVFP